METITRFEYIVNGERTIVINRSDNLQFELQDDGRTLKVFYKDFSEYNPDKFKKVWEGLYSCLKCFEVMSLEQTEEHDQKCSGKQSFKKL